MSGIVEELFIANDSSGVSQVWFRNWSVTASLGLRAQLNADPESVKWGPTKDTFVVRTGTNPATQRYYFFQFARSVSSILGAGVIPAPTQVWTETPGTNTLVLASLSASLNQTVYKSTNPPNTQSKFLYSTINIDSPAPFCTNVFNSGAFASATIEKEVTTGTKTQSVTLADVLAVSGVTVQYGVNSNRHLILYVVGKLPNVTGITTTVVTTVVTSACPPSAVDTSAAGSSSVNARTQTHLWVVNASTAGSAVLYRTALSSGTLTSKTHDNSSTGAFVFLELQAITGTGGCPSSSTCVDNTAAQVSPDANPVSFSGDAGQIEQNGTETQTDNMFDTSLPFVSGTVNPTYAVSAVAAQVQVGTLASLYSYRINYNVGTWAQTNTPWTYNVARVYPITDTAPLAFLMVVTRTRTGLSEHALIYYNGFAYRRLLDFTAYTGASSSLKVLTANKTHAIWYITGTVYMSAFKLGIDGKTVTVSTDVSGMQAQRFRLMYPEETLWAGGETANASPAGTFLDGWEADGTPTLEDLGTGFPVFLPLADFDTLAVVPSGITVPVLPTE